MFTTLGNLWPYMWPADRPDLKRRVVWATFFLVVAKLVLMLVPDSCVDAALAVDTRVCSQSTGSMQTRNRSGKTTDLITWTPMRRPDLERDSLDIPSMRLPADTPDSPARDP